MTMPAGKHKSCEHEVSESAAGPSLNKAPAPSVRRGSSNSQRNHVHIPVPKTRNDEQAVKSSKKAKERSNIERKRIHSSSLGRQEEELDRLLGVV